MITIKENINHYSICVLSDGKSIPVKDFCKDFPPYIVNLSNFNDFKKSGGWSDDRFLNYSGNSDYIFGDYPSMLLNNYMVYSYKNHLYTDDTIKLEKSFGFTGCGVLMFKKPE